MLNKVRDFALLVMLENIQMKEQKNVYTVNLEPFLRHVLPDVFLVRKANLPFLEALSA